MPRSHIRRRAISNSLLADAYLINDDLAESSVSVREAQLDYQVLGKPLPVRLMRLRASIDDAMVEADSSVLTRSFELQHERLSRGIGVRPVVTDSVEPVQVIAETQALEQQYESGGGVVVADGSSQPINDTDDDAAAIGGVEEDESLQPAEADTVASKLNIPVLFEFDSAKLTARSRNTVARLGAALSALGLDKTTTVTVVGHTDSRGAAGYNKALSLRRAQTVLDAIKTTVRSDSSYVVLGKGEEQLRYPGNSKDDHRRNRRVEIIVER